MFVDGWCNDLNMRCTSDRTTCTLDINKLHRTYGALVKSVVIPFSSTCQPGFYWFWRGYFNLKVKTVIFQILAIPCLWIKLSVRNECIVVNPYPLEFLSLTTLLPASSSCGLCIWSVSHLPIGRAVWWWPLLWKVMQSRLPSFFPYMRYRNTPRHECFHNHHLTWFTRALRNSPGPVWAWV